MKFYKWLYPGLYIKRWLALAVLGLLFVGTGVAVVFNGDVFSYVEIKVKTYLDYLFSGNIKLLGGATIIFLGAILISYSFKEIVKSFIKAAFPDYVNTPMKSVYQKQYLRRGPKIVVIGGGTGLSVLLRGLKEYTSNITAIVSVADDGGSSGRIRGSLGILPPGDLRNCLVALSDTESTMEKLFDYRFQQGDELVGHNLGNLLIAAMSDVAGSFEQAIKEVSKVLAIRGRVLPSTLKDIVLCARLEDKSIIKGESNIGRSEKVIEEVFIEPNKACALPEALDAIMDAEIIILGPGSLYTSIIPNLLVDGIPEAIRDSKAIKIYVSNIMTQPGETLGFSVGHHLENIIKYGGNEIVNYVIVNEGDISQKYIKQYQGDKAEPVKVDRLKISSLGIKVVSANLVDEGGEYLRHNSYRLAQSVLKLFLEIKGKKSSLLGLFEYYLISERLKDRME